MDQGGVPLNWKSMVDEEKGDVDQLLGSKHTGAGLGVDQENMVANPISEVVRFCQKCNLFKPPRCHHCSVCGMCRLRMDHHYVWVVNCVGAKNYKHHCGHFSYFCFELGICIECTRLSGHAHIIGSQVTLCLRGAFRG